MRATFAVALLTVLLALPMMFSGSAGAGETVGVRGHWVVEVREADGTSVARREFHNELVPTNPIGGVLRGESTAGPLQLSITCVAATGCTPPCPAAGCVITEARSTFPASAFLFKNLTVTSGIDGLQLRGFAIVSNDSAIGRVETRLVTCAKTVAPSACNAGLLNLLTRTDPLPQIPVSAGQQVLITVTITSGTAGTTSAASPAGGTSPR